MTAMAIRTGILAAALFAVATSPAFAETLSFKADLAPVAGTNSKAVGTFTADYDTDSKKLTWRGNYRGIGTYATGANLHGPDNRIVVRIKSFDSPFEGISIVSDQRAGDLKAGRWYILIRTAAYPNGELRGQIVPAK